MQGIYEESENYINEFLQTEDVKGKFTSVKELLEHYIDMNVYTNDKDDTFRLLGIEKKTPDRKKAKAAQLYNFGLSKVNSFSTQEIVAIQKKYKKFARYFQIQKKFQDIKKLYDEIQE